MARRRRDADEEYDEPSEESEDQQHKDILEIGRLQTLRAKTELEWWATFKTSVPLVSGMSDLALQVAEAKFANPKLKPRHIAEQLGLEADRVSQILLRPRVKDYIKRRQLETRAANNLTREKIILGLLQEAERSLDGSASARVKALELLGKELGMFVDRSEVKKQLSGKLTQEHTGRTVRVIYLPDNGRDPELIAGEVAEPEELPVQELAE